MRANAVWSRAKNKSGRFSLFLGPSNNFFPSSKEISFFSALHKLLNTRHRVGAKICFGSKIDTIDL